MSTHGDLGWRDRAIALAAVGAAAVSRSAFAPADVADPSPLQMQVLVSVALQDSYVVDAPHWTGTSWLSSALRTDVEVVENVVRSLLERRLVIYRSDATEEIRWELGGEDDDELIASELPLALTDLGLATVDRWLTRVRLQFQGWPPDRYDVDDVVA